MTNPPNNNPPPTTSTSSDSDSSLPVDKKKNVPPFNLKKENKASENKRHNSPWEPSSNKNKKENATESKKGQEDPWASQFERKQKKDDQNDQGDGSSEQNSQMITQMNINQTMTSGAVTGAEAASTRNADTAIADAVKSISDYINSMSVENTKSETTVTINIQSDSVFKGSQVEITRTGGDHNIVFKNLTEEAQLLLENRTNQEHLREGLEMKGVTVHVITTERMEQTFTTTNSQGSEQDRGSRDDDNEGGRGGGRQQDQENQ